VFSLHSANAKGCNGGNGSAAEISKAFGQWKDLLSENRQKKQVLSAPKGFLIPFWDERTSNLRLA